MYSVRTYRVPTTVRDRRPAKSETAAVVTHLTHHLVAHTLDFEVRRHTKLALRTEEDEKLGDEKK